MRPHPLPIVAAASLLVLPLGCAPRAAFTPPSTGCEGEDPCTIRIRVTGNQLHYFDGTSTTPTRRIQVAPDQEVEWEVESQPAALFTVQFDPGRTPFQNNRASFGRGHQLTASGQIRENVKLESSYKFSVAVLQEFAGNPVILLDDPELIVDRD